MAAKKNNMFKILSLFILLCPLLYGVMGRLFSPFVYLVMAILAFIGFSQPRQRPALPYEKTIRLVFYGLLVFLVVQLVPLPMFLLKYLSPGTARTLAQMTGQLPLFHSISLIPFDTVIYAFQVTSAAFFYWMIISVQWEKQEMVSLLYTVILSAALLLAVGFLGNLHTLQFSFYLTMVFPLVPALLLMELRYLESNRPLLKKLISGLGRKKKIFGLFFLIVMLPVGIVVTGSRPAISTLFLTAIIFSMWVYYFKRSRSVRRRLRTAFMAAALLVILMGLQSTGKHLMRSRGGYPGEHVRWGQTLGAAKAFPFVGAGFGTWQWVHSLYHRRGEATWPPYANNGGLVILAEGGLMGGVLVFLLFAVPIAATIRLWWQRRHPRVRLLVMGLLVCLLAAGFHSFFNAALRTPANVMAFVLLLALSTKIASHKRRAGLRGQGTGPGKIKMTAAVLIVFFGFQLVGRGLASIGNNTFSVESIGHNPFDYRFHLGLGNTYLSQQPLPEKVFKKGLASLKRAVRLEGGKNTGMTVRVLRLMLSHWQRLGDNDKKLCRKLLQKIVTRIDEETFKMLLTYWESRCRDITLFKGVLKKAPRYYNLAADALGRLQMEMKVRQLFKLNHEIYTLEVVEKEYREIRSQSPQAPHLPDRLKNLRRRLKENIWGYHEMIRDSKFRRQNYRELVKRLDLRILHLLFSMQEKEKAADMIISFLGDNDFVGSDNLEDLHRFLEQRKFFKAGGVRGSFIKSLIRFKMRDYTAVITEMEKRNAAVSFPAAENTKDYCGMLLLLSDAYIASRLLTKALPVLSEVEKRCPQPTYLMELYRQEMKIEHIIGSEDEKSREKDAKTRYNELIRRSHRVEMNDLALETTVYLVDSDVFEIHRGSVSIKNRHLLQVFIDGCIRHEVYVDQWKPDEPVKIRVLPFERFSKHEVEVKIK